MSSYTAKDKRGKAMGNVMPDTKFIQASVISISELQSNLSYMSIRMRMFSTSPNLNNNAVTEAFIDEIVENAEKYLCTPLQADISKMERKDYGGLGHMYNPNTGTFLTQQIGSFYSFEKVADEYGISLIGEARISKRRKEVCEALVELYEANNLKFSFEILAGKVESQNGVDIIDVSDSNMLIGMAVVTVPAYQEAKALALVAETDEATVMEKAFANARDLYIGEVSIEVLHRWVWEAVKSLTGDAWWDINIEKICVDCAILYNVSTAVMYKMDYIVTDTGLVITDFYEVVYRRKEAAMNSQNNEEVKNQDGTEAAPTEGVTPQGDVSAVADGASNAQGATEGTEGAGVKASSTQGDTGGSDVVAQLKEEIARLRAENERITAEQKSAKMEAKRAELREFAQENNLDFENAAVAAAIESVDYEALVSKIMRTRKQETPKQAGVKMVAEIKVDEPFGGILRRTGK